MHLACLILFTPFTLAIPAPVSGETRPLSDDLGVAATTLWGDNGSPFPTDATALTAMHDNLLAYLMPKYPDPCQQQALIVEVGEFFTDANLNTLDQPLEGDLPTSTSLQLYNSALVPRGWKISCRKCKKLVRKIVGIVAPILCAKVAVVTGTATANPAVGSIARYLCLDAARQFEKTGAVELKVQRLRTGGRTFGNDREGLRTIVRPDVLS